MSDPQLRKDIASLTLKLAEAKRRILELEAVPPVIIEREVIKEVPLEVIKRVDVPVIKEVHVPVEVVKEVIKHVKCPKQAALIRELQAKIGGK